MARILFFTQTTGYQARAFEQAAQALGVELVYATDRCRSLDDPWRDGAIPVRFDDVEGAARAVVERARTQAIDGVLAGGDGPARLAAHAALALGLPWHPPAAVMAATSKLQTRGRLLAAGLPVPWFVAMGIDDDLGSVAHALRFPCVVKPVGLSASRGVIRADSVDSLEAALARVRRLLRSPDLRRAPAHERDTILIEGFVPGAEFALEGVLERGSLRVLAIFEKPDPLDGPFFEETIYVTPPRLDHDVQRGIAGTMAHAAAALGLRHGPVHAECRLNESGVFVLEVAPRSIGGLCARALRFRTASREGITLEELLLRHALGEALDGYGRERAAAGVMMVPIPRRGRFRDVQGLDAAGLVPGVEGIVITAKPGQLIVPPPDGGSYLGFIFARATGTADVVEALRASHAALQFSFESDLPLSGG